MHFKRHHLHKYQLRSLPVWSIVDGSLLAKYDRQFLLAPNGLQGGRGDYANGGEAGGEKTMQLEQSSLLVSFWPAGLCLILTYRSAVNAAKYVPYYLNWGGLWLSYCTTLFRAQSGILLADDSSPSQHSPVTNLEFSPGQKKQPSMHSSGAKRSPGLKTFLQSLHQHHVDRSIEVLKS
jgi:hypothetical protein